MANNDGTLIMEDVKIVFRNFSGTIDKYSKEGERTFAVVIDEPLYETLLADKWNAKKFKLDDEEGSEQEYYLPVSLGVLGRGRPPLVYLITSEGRNQMPEHTIGMLDGADIVKVDLIVRPYAWTNPMGDTGVKAYIKSMYVTIEEDPLEKKYAAMDRERDAERMGRIVE